MAQYNPLYGENIFDVAAKLYKETSSGIADLLSLNVIIDFDSDLFGTTLTYTEGLVPEKTVIVTLPQRTFDNTFLTRKDQTVFDLAIQLYGSVSNIGKILELFPNLDSDIDLNTSIQTELQTDPIAKYFIDTRIIVATGFVPAVSTGNRVQREDSSFLLREDGSYILREA